MSDRAFDDHHLQLGYVAGAHGVRGAVRVKLFNPDSDAIEPGVHVLLREREHGSAQSFEVTRVAPTGDVVRLWLAGVEDRESAEQLRGRELWIDRAELPELADDEYYLADLIGLPVEREHDGRVEALGKITGVTSNGAQDLLCVRLRGHEWLLPAMPPFVRTVDATRVLVDVHDDMLPDVDERGSA